MSKKLGRNTGLFLTGAALTALLATPLAGSAANLSSSSFSVRAQNSQQTTVAAIKPGFKKTVAPTPTPEPTPTVAPTPTPTATPTPPPSTVVYQSDFSTVGSKPAEWQMQKEAAWQQTTVISGGANRSNTVGQNDFPYNTELRLKLTKRFEPGTYSVKFKYLLDSRIGSRAAPPYWTLSVNGVQTKQTIPYAPGVYTEITFDGITVPSGGANEILFITGKGGSGNFNLYTIGDVVISKAL